MKKFSPDRKMVAIAVAAVCCVLSAASAIAQFAPPGPPPPPGPPRPPAAVPTPPPLPANLQGFGGSLEGLTRESINAFNQGRIEFTNVETPASGLDRYCARH